MTSAAFKLTNMESERSATKAKTARKSSAAYSTDGVYIAELMSKRGLKNKDLAERMGTTDATVSRLLNGERQLSLDWLRSFADALDVPLWQLIKPPAGARKARGDNEIKDLLRMIDGLPEEAINPLARLISGYIEDAE